MSAVIEEGQIVFNNCDYCGRVGKHQAFHESQPRFVINHMGVTTGPVTAENADQPADTAIEHVWWFWNEVAQRWDMNASAEALKEFRTRGILK